MIVALIASLASAAPAAPRDPLVDALVEELDRSRSSLVLDGSPAPYFIGYDLMDTVDTDVEAVLGGVVDASQRPSRTLGVEVRVGSPALDNVNFSEGWRSDDGHERRTPVLGDDPMALRHTAWLVTDAAYKDAVENLGRRQAARARRASGAEDAPCFGPGDAQVASFDPGPPVPLDELQPLAVALSAVFTTHPDIEWSRVYASAENGRRVLVDTGGTRVVKPEREINVRVVARVRAEDGSTITDDVHWLVSELDDLPPVAEMKARAEQLAERLEGWRTLPAVEEDYVGPVLFSGDAAAHVVQQLLLPALSGTPDVEKPPSGSRSVMFDQGQGAGAIRVKRRLLPPGFDVVDDPTAAPRLPSAFTHDDEGEAVRALRLVDDGVIQTHFQSRTPSRQVPTTNGHGRGNPGELKKGMASHTTLSARRPLNPKKLHRSALSQASAYGLDHYVRIERLEDAAVASLGVPTLSFGGAPPERIRAPIVAVRVYADDREERVRGWAPVGVGHGLLRDLVAAGAQPHTRTVLVGGFGATGGQPVTVVTPDLVFSELELSANPGGGERPPALPSPLASSGPR